jgi:hypothetical protein
MTNPEYTNGYFCTYKAIFCLDGYRTGCERCLRTHCPRCIGDNMYRDNNGKYVCIQCGCTYYPDTVTKIPVSR